MSEFDLASPRLHPYRILGSLSVLRDLRAKGSMILEQEQEQIIVSMLATLAEYDAWNAEQDMERNR